MATWSNPNTQIEFEFSNVTGKFENMVLLLFVFSKIYLRPKVTLHFSVPNISSLILILRKLIIAMSSQHIP